MNMITKSPLYLSVSIYVEFISEPK